MRRVTFANYWLTNEHGKRRRSTWKMTEAEAKRRDPNAELVPGTQEVRDLPEGRDEWEMTSDFLKRDKD